MSLLIACAMATTLAKPQVMVLGTFHFANPGLDAVKVKQRDIRGADRQKEVEELVASLAKFKPTKIFVEQTPERQAELVQQYGAYVEANVELSESETQQVGFRLAKKFGLACPIGVDYKSDMDFDGVLQFAAKNGMADIPQKMGGIVQKMGAVMSEWDQKYSVSQLLAIHNHPDFIRQGQSLYTMFLKVGKHPDYPGADMVAGWYRRNMVIYENIRQQLKPDDRAIVIYGSGHAYYLNQLLRDDANVDFVESGKFLPKSPLTQIPDLGL